MVEIYLKEVDNDYLKKQFIDFPYKLFKDEKNWVPPLKFDVKNNLDTKKNPFYQHAKIKLWIAFKDGTISGRIAAILNDAHNKFYNEKTGFFGFFECINDQATADLLFNEASNWLKENRMERIRGPVNPSMNDECGMLIDAFDQPPVMLMPYNPPYYIDLVEKCGFRKAKDLYALDISKDVIKNEKMMEKLDRIANLVLKKEGLTLRNLNMKDFENDTLKVREVYNNAWQENWGFVPMTDAEFRYVAKNLKAIADPDFIQFAEKDGVPVGFSLALPDINQVLINMNGTLFPFGIFKFLAGRKKINNLRVMIMGVKKEYHKKGIDAAFYRDVIKMGNKKNFRGAEISWVLEDNHAMIQAAEKLGAKIYKTYRIWEKSL